MDWPVIGAVGGVAVLASLVGIGAITMLRSGPEEVKKAPPAPLLWSTRPADAPITAPPEARLFAPANPAGATYATASLSPATASSGTQYQLFPASEPAPVADERPSAERPTPPAVKRPAEPVAKQTVPHEKKVAPSEKRISLAYAPSTSHVLPAKPEPPKIVDRRYDGVLTPPEIMRVKASLRLTPDQEPHWRPVEAQLREIGRLQIAQVNSGRKPEVPQSAAQTLFYTAQPLLASLRPEQKERVRQLARSIGYASVASMI